MQISELLTPRDEVLEGRFQGVLQAHKVTGDDERLENDPNRLLTATYPSNALRNVFDRVADKLAGRDSQGGIMLTGPYGSGKSHGLLVLYHMFNHPTVAQSWADEWDIPIDLPTDSDAAIVSTSETDADLIWEPIYRSAGREDVLEEIDRYPTTDHVEKLAENGTYGVFFDEIEAWWESFSEEADRDLLERNRFFLQNLLEVANDPNENLFAFITLLDRSDRLKEILDRTNPHAEDLNATGDRERIIIHRLFEGTPDDIDESTVRSVVEQYVDSYEYPIEIDEPKRYENRMVETYPFHPELLDLLDSIYEAARERQNVRGVMNVLADTVRQVHDETDLVVTSDVNPRAFRGINRTLFDRFTSDKEELGETEHGVDLLQVILLYTLDDRSQMASTTQCLLGTFKPDETTVDRLHMTLEGLYGTAHYLDKQDGSYFITEDPKLTALITREQERILEENRDRAVEKLVDVVRDEVFDGSVYVYGYDDVPDESKQTFVVTLENISNGTLTSELSDFFEERRYQNTVQFITPKQSVLEDDDIVSKAARVFGAENLRGKVEDEQGELEPLIRDEYRQLRKELESRYGKWVKWSSTPDGDLRLRRITVDPDIEAVKERIGKDTTYVGEEIVARVKENEGGIRVGSLLNDFLQFRRLPVLLDEGVFYSAVSELQRKGDIVLEGNRANFYVGDLGQYPTEIEDEMTIRHPDNLPESVFREETDDDEDETGDDDSGGGITDWGGDDETDDKTEDDSNGDDETEPTETEHSTETVEVSLEGNSARVLKSTAESRINETTDTATHVRLSYDVGALSKSELIGFIEGLPNGEKIEAKVVIERDADE
ncbi:DUF499 domain-containing protein [Haloplanus pelagicus]|uniref:DUF499 domain-containing protein n=1 Tax=Haloplanus pelagicus TaxID=2949995 RepID=UPI00203B75B9|nr:DUF499 domain-containing protein [Haloplanus sp. HW8-1]